MKTMKGTDCIPILKALGEIHRLRIVRLLADKPLGVCEIAREGVFGALPVPALNVVSGIIKNCDSLIPLINDILDFEKFDSGKMQLTLEETNLTSVMASVKQTLQTECSASFEI